jgi:hypothetical protein
VRGEKRAKPSKKPHRSKKLLGETVELLEIVPTRHHADLSLLTSHQSHLTSHSGSSVESPDNWK